MTSKLNGFFGVGLEGLQVHQVFLPTIYLVCSKGIHKIREDGDIEEVETRPINKGRHSQDRNYPADQDAIKVRKMGWNHDNGSLGCQSTNLISLPRNLNFILKGKLVTK